MPRPCPVCLGSGLNMHQGTYWQFGRGNASRCGKCDGKGWLDDEPGPSNSADLESEVVYEVLKQHVALNIDDIAALKVLDIPTVYRSLVSLRDKGLVGTKSESPILYHVIKSQS